MRLTLYILIALVVLGCASVTLKTPACDDGPSCYRLGASYFDDASSPRKNTSQSDMVVALRAFEASCKAGFLRGCHAAGNLWLNSSPSQQRLANARSFYLKACDSTETTPEACSNLFRLDKATTAQIFRQCLRDRENALSAANIPDPARLALPRWKPSCPPETTAQAPEKSRPKNSTAFFTSRCVDRQGLSHGTSARWNSEGALIEFSTFNHGEATGPSFFFDRGGRLTHLSTYAKGLREGFSFHGFSLTGSRSGFYRQDKKDGLWCDDLTPDGQRSAGFYQNGAREGEWYFVDPQQGSLVERGNYSQGQKQGLWVSDALGEEFCFVKGQLSGPYRRYDRQGRAVVFGQYALGQRAGWWTWYQRIPNEGGPSSWQEHYVDDVRTETRTVKLGDVLPTWEESLKCP